MTTTLTTKIITVTALGALSLGAVACSSDSDNNDNPVDNVVDSVDAGVDNVVGT